MHTWSVMRLTILRHLRTSPIRVLVTVAGVAIGVATFTAIQTTNESVLSSFTRAIDLVAGRTTLEISGGELGIDERFLPAIQRVEGVSAAAPIIHTVAAVADRPGDALLLMGVDLFAEDPFREYRLADGDRPPAMEELLSPDAIFVTTAFARTHGLRKGESLTLLVGLRRQRFSVKGLLARKGRLGPSTAISQS